MWLIKRTLVDGWQLDRALEEATALGLSDGPVKQFMLEQIRTRQR
jgi:hypothetical protein